MDRLCQHVCLRFELIRYDVTELISLAVDRNWHLG